MTYARPQWLIFTDLDGCLLDHYDYSFGPAIELLRELNERHIPVIPATSKTESEVRYLRRILENAHPFIVENGAAVFVPAGYFPMPPEGSESGKEFWVAEFTRSRSHWRSLIDRVSVSRDRFQTFSDSTVQQIAALTGLDAEAAIRASQRSYGEPVAWRGSLQERERFVSELERAGAKILQGGRFLHVSGACDKGKAMDWLAGQFQKAHQAPVATIAVGDGQNDVGMLESADIAVLIPSPSHRLPELNRRQGVYTAERQGSAGWADTVSAILQNLNIQ